MKNRRTVLKMLGLSAIAAPAAVNLASEVGAAPMSGVDVYFDGKSTIHWIYPTEAKPIARFYERLLGKPRGSFVCVSNGTPCFHVPDVNAL